MRRSGTASSRGQLAPWLVLAALLLLWCAVSGLRLVGPLVLPTPWAMISALPHMVGDEHLLMHLGATLARVLIALGIAASVGISLGLFLGYRMDIYRSVEAPLHALRSIPATALFPLLLIVVGVGDRSIIALATYPALLVILVNCVNGAALANKRRLHQAAVLGLTPWRIVTDVLLYEALPSIFDGLRTAVSYALVLVIAVEMFLGVSQTGLGQQIYRYQSTYRIPETYGLILLAGLTGIGLNALVSAAERRMLRWMPHTESVS